MTINDERKTKTVPFKTIKHGEVFTDEEGDYMMRIMAIYDADDVTHNAVDLATGDTYNLAEDDFVIRINRAVLTIQN